MSTASKTSRPLDDYVSGSTEPWTAELVAELAAAIDAKLVLETGTFRGFTTTAISKRLPDATIHTVEFDAGRCYDLSVGCLRGMLDKNVLLHMDDALGFMYEWWAGNVNVALDDGEEMSEGLLFDFIFLDDDHSYNHVAAEVDAARKILRPGGILTMHDVHGPFGLDGLVPRGGIALDLPKLHVAGGLGIWQKPG